MGCKARCPITEMPEFNKTPNFSKYPEKLGVYLIHPLLEGLNLREVGTQRRGANTSPIGHQNSQCF
jgi:hypothetical protein